MRIRIDARGLAGACVLAIGLPAAALTVYVQHEAFGRARTFKVIR